MEQEEIKELITNKLNEAKLSITEKRNNFLILLFGVLMTVSGIIVPLIQSDNNSERTNKSIERSDKSIDRADKTSLEMKNDLKSYLSDSRSDLKLILTRQDSAIAQTKRESLLLLKRTENEITQKFAKPNLVFRFNYKEVSGTIDITGMSEWAQKFDVINSGSTTANKIKMILYLKENSKLIVSNDRWNPRESNEEAGYKKAFYHKIIDSLDPREPIKFENDFSFGAGTKNAKEECLLLIFYGQPEPKRINFVIQVGMA